MFHVDLITTDATTSYFQRRHNIRDKQHYDGCLCFSGLDLRFYFDTLDPTLLFSCNLAGFCSFSGSEHLSPRFCYENILYLEILCVQAWGILPTVVWGGWRDGCCGRFQISPTH